MAGTSRDISSVMTSAANDYNTFFFFLFWSGGKMAKSFKDVVKDSPRTGLGIPVETKNPLSRTKTPPAEPPFGFKLHGWLVPAKSRVRLCRHSFARNSHPRLHDRLTDPLAAST